MARAVTRQARDDTRPTSITIDKFNKGFINLTEESRTPPDAAAESTNLIQVQDGVWQTRWGTRGYGATHADAIDGATEYVASDGSTELITVAGGNVYKSTDGGTRTQITGATLTAGVPCWFKQLRGVLYIINGTDNIVRYNGSVLSSYSALATPGAITVTRGAGLSAGSYNYYYQVVATNEVGFTPGGTESSITGGTNKLRENFSGTSDYIDLSWSRVTGASRYDIYISDRSGFEVYLDSVPDPGSGSVTYRDDGTVAPNDNAEVPTDNTTQGPKVAQMEISGNQLWGTKDDSNQQRVYWTGAGQYQGYFSPFYGGGYVDLEKGGRERPYAVADFRDGKGTPVPVVLTGDPEGVGSVWQISLESATVGDTTFLVPNVQKLVKSVGTSAPGSVVKVKDDIMFMNKRGVFSLGTKPNVLNILSTDEISANIRPYVRDLRKMYMDGVVAYHYDAKVFFAIPKTGTTNSHIIVFDTERRSWAVDWDVAIKQFLEYTDTSGEVHFLGVPSSGTKLVELSENHQGDDGAAFETRYSSPLLPVSKDRFAWAQMTRALFEFSNLQGTVTISVLGTEKRKQFSTVATRTVSDTTSNAGIGSLLFGEALFSACTPAPTTYSQSSTKKYLRLNKLLNNVKFQISSSSNNTKFTLLSLKADGFEVPTSPPSQWKT